MNGAQPGEARLCAASLRAPLPAPTSPRPAHPDPCCQGAETRRPLRTQTRTTHKVRGGRARRAPGRGVHGGVSRELVGGEWHRAPGGQGWTGGCALAGRVFGSAKRTCSLRPEGNSRAGASSPGTELSVAGSSGSRGIRPGNPHREARTILSGEDAELGTDSIRLLSGRALGASLQRLHTASPVLWFAFIPPSPLST